MDRFLMARAKLKQLYAHWDIYIIPALKFLTALSSLLVINSMIGYRAVLTRPPVFIIIALVCALLPWKAIPAVAAVVVLLHLLSLSWEVAAAAAAFMVMMVILHFLFLPGASIAIILVPVAYVLTVPYAVPLIVGVVGGATSFIPVGLGVFAYYFLSCVQRNANLLSSKAVEATILSRFTVLLDALRSNRLMMLSIAAFCIVTILVYTLRKMSVDYAPVIALAVGGIVNMLIFLLGGFALNITVPYVSVIIGTIFSLLIAAAVQFWILAVDYSRTEYLHFEDEEYVYYVKAVPKITFTEQRRRVKEINSLKSEDPDERAIEEAIGMLDSIDREETTAQLKAAQEQKDLSELHDINDIDLAKTGPIGIKKD